MSINRVIAKALSKSNCKVVHGNVVGQINPYMEWVKWLSYETERERQLCESVNVKSNFEISYNELYEVGKIKRNRMFLELFKKYGTSECSEKEYMLVYDYMCTESIENLMMSKLSLEELYYAKERIIYFSQLPKEELNKKICEEQLENVYNKLSMVDSYILHILSDINFARSMKGLEKEINAQINTNNVIYHRSLYYSSNPYLKR